MPIYPARTVRLVAQSHIRITLRLPRGVCECLGVIGICLLSFGLNAAPSFSQGLYRDGIGARSVSLGGADVAYAADPLGAMTANPAGLGLLSAPELDVDLGFAVASGKFTNSSNPDANLYGATGFIPDGAFAAPLHLRGHRFAVGFSVVPNTALAGSWHYVDPPGGVGGTSYGAQQIKSETVGVRAAGGLGFAINKKISVGGTIGVLYNENRLRSPYVFQTQPILTGLKTLLNLKTTGYGWNTSFGVLVRPTSAVQLGLDYQSKTRVVTHGTATGDISAQFATLGIDAPSTFRYDGRVTNVFPDEFSSGVSWRFKPQLRGVAQFDWIRWGAAFVNLPVQLTNGSNATINTVAGSTTLQDNVPLDWRDQYVYRVGLEGLATETSTLRAGFSHANSPVPDSTLTPLTAAIMQNSVNVGWLYRHGKFRFDSAYQHAFSVAQQVGTSLVKAGEFSNTRTRVGEDTFTVTTSCVF
jgi:long-subunit fatty acid transport protein